MPKWTQRQLQAITARNQEILVSAAAGSGKTAVLIERVLSLLKEGGQLDRMLVMTFTHAAADEMKERLTDLLSESALENEHLRAQFALLGRADISTLHSFCTRILRRYFQAADTDPLSRQADETLAGELFSQALDEALARRAAHAGIGVVAHAVAQQAQVVDAAERGQTHARLGIVACQIWQFGEKVGMGVAGDSGSAAGSITVLPGGFAQQGKQAHGGSLVFDGRGPTLKVRPSPAL